MKGSTPMARSAAEIQQEIEQARASLAVTVDQIAERTDPKRLVNEAKQSVVARARTPQGMAIIGGSGTLIVLLVVRNIRKAKRNRS
jgi:hypothetical protein